MITIQRKRERLGTLKHCIPILLALMSLVSCDRTAPVVENLENKATDPALASAQLTLARNHLANNEPAKAIPYLKAALQESEEAKDLLSQTLSSARFRVPSALLRHPFPVLRFTEDTGKAIFVALGGKHPTVIRWSLNETPEVTAILFPTNAADISHLLLSPDGLHLLVHRDKTNLLCNARTLKPIANLGEFPANLDPNTCQPFTKNGLLVANPTAAEYDNHVWQIRDTATGEILRSESFEPYPKPVSARFEDTTLCIEFEGGREIRMPVQGEAETIKTKGKPHADTMVHPKSVLTDEFTVALSLPIPRANKEPVSAPLLSAIAGYELDPTTQTLFHIPIPNRLAALSEAFPGQLPQTLKLHSSEVALTRRLAAAYPEEFPEISAAAIAHAEIIRKTFDSSDPVAITAVIDSSVYGLPLATALFISLESGNHSFIERAAAKAKDMPAAIRSLVRNATVAIPDPAALRLEQDWLGYESPDFSPLFRKASARKSYVLSHLSLPDEPSTEDIDALIGKLLNPGTEAELGRAAIADCTIGHAIILAMDSELAAHALELSAIARRYGSKPALCLRTNATAFTSIGDFKSAHRTWIDLITNQPEADHLASDYSEAAYTAFETGDVRQAMEILNTGLFRFPKDVAFAIRAGWIALLTDHPSEALVCLKRATQLGLPPAEIENTTALLAITYLQLGDPETAGSYVAQLIAISQKWQEPENVDSLPWPESFTTALKEIISQQPETEPGPSQESDPKDTAPRPAGFPIQEPPLPLR
mgnify:CR=1 FL=1